MCFKLRFYVFIVYLTIVAIHNVYVYKTTFFLGIPESTLPSVSSDLISEMSPRQKKLRSIKQVLLCSNATPMWTHSDLGYKCSYCEFKYPELDRLKKHTLEEHDEVMEARFLRSMFFSEAVIKLDVTGLCCKLCLENIDGLNSLIEHLNSTHNKRIDSNISNLFLPFKFHSDTFYCGICSVKFASFKSFEQHAKNHMEIFKCETCNAGFRSKERLECHVNTKHKQSIAPRKSTQRKGRQNLTCVCSECGERFATHYLKKQHVRKIHIVAEFNCNACDRFFATKDSLQLHVRRDHLMERPFPCIVCDKAFFKKEFRQKHELSHSDVKKFSCHECGKMFKQKSSLGPHMHIHRDERRFQCEVCLLKFVQKSSLKSHMRARHGVSLSK